MNDTKGGTAMFNLEPVYVSSENISARALPFHTPGGGRNLSADIAQDHAPGQEGALSKLGHSGVPGWWSPVRTCARPPATLKALL